MSFNYLARTEEGRLAERADIVYRLNCSQYLRRMPCDKGTSLYICPLGRILINGKDLDHAAEISFFPRGLFKKSIERNHKFITEIIESSGIKLERIE